MKKILTNPFYRYLARLGALFCLFYFGTLLIIGLSSEGNNYSPFVADYLDYITPLRHSLLTGSDFFLHLAGYPSVLLDDFVLALEGGRGVRMVYSCVGYGVLAFWIAFVIANSGSWQKKALWVVGGCIALCLLNMARICLLLVAINKGQDMPFGMDHHTLFNIAAYGFIFGMIYFYDRSKKKAERRTAA